MQLICYLVTLDFTGIFKSSSIEKFRLGLAFSNVVGLGNAGKVLNLARYCTATITPLNVQAKALFARNVKFYCFGSKCMKLLLHFNDDTAMFF